MVEAVLSKSKIEMDVVFFLDEIYLQKDAQYQGRKLVGEDG